MDGRVLLLILTIVIAVSCATPKLPDYLKRCSRSSGRKALNDCLKVAIEDGITKLKKGDETLQINEFDPLRIEKIVTSKSGALISLDVNQKDAEIRGFGEGVKLEKLDFNFQKKVFSASLLAPKLTLDSYQVLKGKIVGIPLTWSGDMTGNITKVKCDFVAPFESVEIDGKEHLKFFIDRIKLDVDVENVKVRHKESSPKEKLLALAADTIINNNWRLVFSVLKTSYQDIFRKQLGQSLVGVFSAVPLDGIFLD